MANNIKIVGNILNNSTINRYSENDNRLISSFQLNRDFGQPTDYIEYHIYDVAGNLLSSNFNYKSFKSPSTFYLNPSGTLPIIEIDPINDLQIVGFSSGEFIVNYNFFSNRISDINADLFIKEISSDRTELRISSTTLTNNELQVSASNLINEINNSSYYKDFLLNFGSNTQILAVNITTDQNDILLKLYQPLPLNINLKDSFWIVDEIVEPHIFDINLDKFIIPDPLPKLRGPNFGIEVKYQNTTTTQYKNYQDLVLLQQSYSSSYRQILNFLNNPSIRINVDYTDFSNFVHFSNAEKRVSNFYNKIKNIENYQNFITKYTPFTSTTGSFITEINNASSSIESIITNFDGYENYLYFESSSFTWPKSGSIKPYSLLSTSSLISVNWFNNTIVTASLYDEFNLDNLENVIPSFVREDKINQPYLDFTDMIGHFFDNIWIYLKAITDLYKNDNNLNEGISKDLVYSALQSLGIDLYNDKGGDDFYNYIIGTNSGSYNSYDNIPRKDLLAETYKRIYHNLPYLIQSKGTEHGLRALINCFGIPSTILRIDEFGGINKLDTGSTDYTYDKFDYALNYNNTSSATAYTSWAYLTKSAILFQKSSSVADTIEFRFKLPTGSNINTFTTSSLYWVGGGTSYPGEAHALKLIRSGSWGKIFLSFNTNVTNSFIPTSNITSFGDSITAGQNATSNNGYIQQLASYYGVSLNNRAISGRGLFAMASSSFAGLTSNTTIISAMAGFNDYRRSGVNVKTDNKLIGAYNTLITQQWASSFVNGVNTAVSWSVAVSSYAAQQVGGKYGTGFPGVPNTTNAGFIGPSSTGFATWSFFGNNVVVGLIGNSGDIETFSTVKIYIDNILQTTISTNNLYDNISDGIYDNRRGPYAISYFGLSNASHSIKVESQADGYMVIDYFATLNNSSNCKPIFLYEIPYMDIIGYATSPANANSGIFSSASLLIKNIVNSYASQSYPILYIPTNNYYSASTSIGLSSDHIHPNDTGHTQIEQGTINTISSTVSSNLYSNEIILPVFNDDWWNIMIRRDNGNLNFSETGSLQTYRFFIKNKIDGKIGFTGSSFLTIITSSINKTWYATNNSNYSSVDSKFYLGSSSLSCSFQELRFWAKSLKESEFNYHVLNPESWELEEPSSSFDYLAARFPLGLDLRNYSGSSTIFISSSHFDQVYRPFYNLTSSIENQLTLNRYSVINNNFIGNTEQFYLKPLLNNSLTKTSNKVSIVNTQITGSILSPFIKIEDNTDFYQPTENLDLINISFSPTFEIQEDELNEKGHFNIDNYIGDPRDEGSSSYSSLNALKLNYFRKVSSSYNYQDYINLIQYFDNSLFKIIKNWIPARVNLATGIIIHSPVLERNKIARKNPIFTTSSITDAEYDISSIGEDKSYMYKYLDNNKKPFYTGELTGSILNIYKYFTETNFNPYKFNTPNLDRNFFNHSDFNITLNNISSSRPSLIRKKLDTTSGSYQIFTQAELQDSYEDLTTHQLSRYNGVRVSSRYFNTWSIGDISYGKNSVVDRYVRKLGLFIEIVSSSFLNRRNNTVLKYLVDENGGLTELNEKNKNWFEVQNTYKAGDNLIVSLFDNQKYSNQKTLNGEKPIFNSGYSYYPILYFSGSDSRLYFEYSGQGLANLFRAINVNGGFISGSGTPSYPLIGTSFTSSYVYNIFNIKDINFSDGNVNYTLGSSISQTFPTFSVPQAGNYKFTASFAINFNFATSSQNTYFNFGIFKNGNLLNSQSNSFSSSFTPAIYSSYKTNGQTDCITNTSSLQDFMFFNSPMNPVAQPSSFFSASYNVDITLYSASIAIGIIPSGSIISGVQGGVQNNSIAAFQASSQPCLFCSPLLIGVCSMIIATGSSFSPTPNLPGTVTGSTTYTCSSCAASPITYYSYGFTLPASSSQVSNLSTNMNFSVGTSFDSYSAGDKVTFQLKGGVSTANYTASVTTGEVRDQLQANQQGNNPFVDSSGSNGLTPFVSGSTGGDTFILSEGLSGLIDFYFYLPSTGSNALYSRYGDIDYTFSPKQGDILIVTYGGGTQTQEFTIKNAYRSGSKEYLQVDPDLPSLLSIPTYTNSTIDLFLLLTRVDDETNIIITFKKRTGKTSYGFVIPRNLHPDVLANIDVITKEVKQKLLNENLTTTPP